MNISQLLTVSLSTSTDASMGTVVFTGVSIVFFVLILLYIIITIQGVLFKNASKKAASADVSNAPQPLASAEMLAPVVEDGISNEVVAAITAAIACMEGSAGFTVKSVKRAKERRNAWGNAAAVSYTEPF